MKFHRATPIGLIDEVGLNRIARELRKGIDQQHGEHITTRARNNVVHSPIALGERHVVVRKDGVLQLIEIARTPVRGSISAHLRQQEPAQLMQIHEHRHIRLTIEHQEVPRQFESAALEVVAHKHTTAVFDLNQPHTLELMQRLAHGGAIHPQLFGQYPLRRQRRAGWQVTADNAVLDLLHDFLMEPGLGQGTQRTRGGTHRAVAS